MRSFPLANIAGFVLPLFHSFPFNFLFLYFIISARLLLVVGVFLSYIPWQSLVGVVNTASKIWLNWLHRRCTLLEQKSMELLVHRMRSYFCMMVSSSVSTSPFFIRFLFTFIGYRSLFYQSSSFVVFLDCLTTARTTVGISKHYSIVWSDPRQMKQYLAYPQWLKSRFGHKLRWRLLVHSSDLLRLHFKPIAFMFRAILFWQRGFLVKRTTY